jgi:hypothetical protein
MSRESIRPKKTGLGMGIIVQTKTGKSGNNYLFMKLPNGSYRTYLCVRRDDAAKDCGAEEGTISKMCRDVMGI